MMSLPFIAISSFIIALSGALVPGPLFSITIAESTRRGFIAGPLVILGHGILELFLILLLLTGIKPLFTAPLTRIIISLAGGIILLHMGYRMIKGARNSTLLISSGGTQKDINPVFSGILGSISNPYWSIWWVTIGIGYLISSMKFGFLGVFFFFIGHILADLSWFSLISFAVAKGERVIGDRGYRFLLYSCGTFLIFFGFWFLKGV